MMIPSFLKMKLRNNCVAWCIGVPYTEEQFKECISMNSDFIESLAETYNIYDYDLLWEQYKITANQIYETVVDLKSRNVKIVHLTSIDKLKDVLNYENIIVTAHHHRFQFAMDFMGYTIPIRDFIDNVPLEYSGTIDVSSCYSAAFLQELKLQASNARIIAANTESSLDLRMFIYKYLVKYLAKNNKAEYLDAYKDVTGKIVSFYRGRHQEGQQKVMLGGKPQSVSVSAPSSVLPYHIIDDCESGIGLPPQRFSENKRTYTPQSNSPKSSSFWSRLFCKKNKLHSVYSSVFAPAEIAPKQHLRVQVYLHLPEETEKVKSLASEADKNAERRGYEPLEMPLKKGDNVEIELNVNGDSLLYNCRKSVKWQGSFVKRAFDFVVPADINVYELSNSVNIYVNGAIAGELIFLTAIVDSPRQLNTNVYARPTKKLFISYSHKDIASAEKIAKIHEALGIDVFFDKHRLKAGYIYSEEISKFIHTADKFILCWSDNAAKSDYVEKERREALALAYPQIQPREQARLKILPFNIEPYADPPADMIKDYHFEEL